MRFTTIAVGFFIAFDGNAKNLGISEKAATFLVLKLMKESSPSSSLSDDMSKVSSKTIPPHIAIQSFLLQMRVSSSVLK